MTIDITKLSLEELKVTAYDFIAALENAKANLELVNREIAKRLEPKLEPKPETKK